MKSVLKMGEYMFQLIMVMHQRWYGEWSVDCETQIFEELKFVKPIDPVVPGIFGLFACDRKYDDNWEYCLINDRYQLACSSNDTLGTR